MAREVERRWLCMSCPHSFPSDHKAYVINQVFLSNPEGTYERVRCRMGTGDDVDFVEYTHTSKTPVSVGVAEEDEKTISQAKFESMKAERRDLKRKPITKVRTVFDYVGRTFEFDQFLGELSGVYILELEGSWVGEPVELPPWILIEREVTGVDGYSNYQLALL